MLKENILLNEYLKLYLSLAPFWSGYFVFSEDITSHSDSEQVLQLLGPLNLQLLDVS